MRWLTKYPITPAEIERELEEIQIVVGPDSPVGDIRPMIRRGIQTFFADVQNMAKLVDHLKVET